MPTPVRTDGTSSTVRPPAGRWDDPAADKELAAESERSYRTKDGLGFKGILIPDKTTDLPFLKLQTADYFIDIVPWFMGPNHPRVLTGIALVGSRTYIVEAYAHKNVGPNKDRYICLAKTLGQACPICEYLTDLSNKEMSDADITKQYQTFGVGKYPQNLYNIWDRKEEAKGVQILQISKFFLERHLQGLSKSPGPVSGGVPITYSSHRAGEQGGRHISFHVQLKGRNMEITLQQFYVRQAPLPLNILESTYQLDDLLYYPDYKEVNDAFYGQAEEATAAGGVIPASGFPYEVTAGEDEPRCPFEAETIGIDFNAFEECQGCVMAITCKELHDQMTPTDMPPEPTPEQERQLTPTPAPTPAPAPAKPTPASAPAKPTPRPVAISPTPAPAPTPSCPTPIRRAVT